MAGGGGQSEYEQKNMNKTEEELKVKKIFNGVEGASEPEEGELQRGGGGGCLGRG